MLDQAKADQFLDGMRTARLAGDVDRLALLFETDAHFAIVGFCPAVKGRDTIRPLLHDLVAQFEFLEWERIKAVVSGHDIAVRHRLKVKHRPNGQVVETETAEFLTIRDGLCTSFVQFADTALIVGMSQGPS